jgi:hypothetical protein
MSHVLALLARVLLARNPLITQPLTNTPLWENAGNPKAAEGMARLALRAINDPFFLRLKGVETTDNIMTNPDAAPWLIASQNLGLAGIVSFPRVYLKSVEPLRDALLKLAKPEDAGMAPNLKLSLDSIIDADPMREPFALIALVMGYEQIVRSSLFDKIPPAEQTTEKAPYAMLHRILMMTALMRTLSIQTPLLRIRPILRYLRMEQSRARLREGGMSDPQLQHWEAIIDKVLELPVHPWIARAEEVSLPTARITPWGDATPTILLERNFLASPWDGLGNPSQEERSRYAADVNKRLDAVELLTTVQPLLLEIRKLMIDLDDEGRFAKVAATLGFTKPRGPVPVPLWSSSFKPVHLDGLNATESVSDLIALSFQPHLPVQGTTHSPWVGEDAWEHYEGALRVDGRTSTWSEYVGSIAISPEDVVADMNFYTEKIGPRALRYKKDDFKGDLNHMIIKSDVDSVARLLGKETKAFVDMVLSDPGPWSHLFDVVRGAQGPTGIKPAKPGEDLFYSDRTRMPWLTTVDLPRRGVPTIMWAFTRGLAETALPTRARFLRDPIAPLATVPTANAVATLIATAIPAPLKGLQG